MQYPKCLTDMEMFENRGVIVSQCYFISTVDEVIVSEPWVAEVMHAGTEEEGQQVEFVEVGDVVVVPPVRLAQPVLDLPGYVGTVRFVVLRVRFYISILDIFPLLYEEVFSDRKFR